MEESSSESTATEACDYLSLLQQIEELSNLAIEWNNLDPVSRKPFDISASETIFENLTLNIKNLSNRKNTEKNAMFCISILNTIVRISVINEFSYVISRKPFQSMFEELKTASEFFIFQLTDETISLPMLTNDIFNSILLNLVKDDLIKTCLSRLLSNDMPSDKGKFLHTHYY